MKVSVAAQVFYTYEVNVPEGTTDLACYCDSYDPVYSKITRLFNDNGIDFDGEIISIINEDTDETLYTL